MEKRLVKGVVTTVSFLTIITIVSKLLGLLREVGIAASFGVGLTTDAFYAALIIPALLFTSVGVAIQNLFMIEFTKIKKLYEDKNEESKLSSNISNILLLTSFVIFIVSFIFTKPIIRVIAPGFEDPVKLELTIKLTRILLPTMVIIPLYQIRASMLRVYNKFITVSVIDLGFNLFQIAYLLLFSTKFGIEGLAISILAAYLTQWITIEVIAFRMGFRHKAILNFNDSHFRTILRLFIPTFISFGIIQVNAMVDKMIASNLGDGAISALNFGFMVRNIVYTILISQLLVVIYPMLLKHEEHKDEKAYTELGLTTFKLIWSLVLPLSVILIVFSDSVIRILFERGDFDGAATKITAGVLFYYAIGITFFAVREFFIHIAYTKKNTKMPLYITLIGALLNIIFSIILKTYMGVNGIAFGLAISEIITAIVIVCYNHKNKYLDMSHLFNDFIKILVINLVLGLGLYFLYPYLYLPASSIVEVLMVLIYGLIFLGLYYLALSLFRVTIIKDLIKQLKGE